MVLSYSVSDQCIAMGGSLAKTNLPQALASASYNAANQLTSSPAHQLGRRGPDL